MNEVRTVIADVAQRAEAGVRFATNNRWLDTQREDKPLDTFAEVFDSDEKGHLLIKVVCPLVSYDMVRGIPGSVVNAKDLYWTLPLSWSHCIMMRRIFGDDLKVGPKLAKWSIHEYDTRIAPCLELKEAKDWEGDSRLYPWQRAAVAFLKIARKALLWDDTRLGKTVEIIQTMKELHEEGERVLPALIICPPNAKRVWGTHFAQWWPSLTDIVVPKMGNLGKTQKALTEPFNVMVIHYELLQYLSSIDPWPGRKPIKCRDCDPESTVQPTKCEVHAKELNNIGWGSIIADEGHRATRADMIEVRALSRLGKTGVELFVFGTGTPPDHPDRFWTMNHIIAPDEWPVRGRFRKRYCIEETDEWTGFTKIEGWNEEMRPEAMEIAAPRILRRTKEVVHATYHGPIYEVRDSEMTPQQAKAYRDLRIKLMAEVEGGIFWAADARVKVSRLRQFASAYAELLEDGSLRLSEPSGKLDTLDELLEELDGSAVLYAEQKQLLELALVRLGDKAVKLVGGMGPQAAAANIDAFQNGEVPYILCNSAGGEAIKLDYADTLIFIQRPWYRIANQQALSRVYKEGRPSFIYDLITPDTIEERVIESLNEHEANFERMVQDEELVRRWLAP